MKRCGFDWKALALRLLRRMAIFIGVGTTMCAITALAAPYVAFPTWAARKAFEQPERTTLYSLDPSSKWLEDKPNWSSKNDPRFFHGFYVLGKVELSAEESKQVRDAVEVGLRNPFQSWAIVAPAFACGFSPHHAVRVVRDGTTADVVICFLCPHVEVYSAGKTKVLYTTRAARPVFNRILKANNVPITKHAEG